VLTRLLLVVLFVACGGSVLHGQSLAEAAAKEKERRAKAAASSTALTDADLKKAADQRAKEGGLSSSDGRSPSPRPAGSRPAAGPTAAPISGSPADSNPSDASKRARAAEYRPRLAAAERSVKQAEADLRWAEEHGIFVNSHSNQTYALDEANTRLARAKDGLQRARAHLSEIEDAARREGIPPGYLR
jgi:hypothetical protein